MAQYFDFAPNSVTAYTFAALLDGVQYNAVVTWNRFGLRWYLNLYTTQGAFVYSTPVVESPDGYDVSLLPASFTAVLVFRESTQQFEIWDAPNTYPSYSALPDYMLDSGLGQFVLDSSSLLGNDVMFDALGKPIILDQGQLPSEAMLDANGMQMVLGPSTTMNQGMLSATFSVAPLAGAIITATDANGVQYPMGSGDGSITQFNTPQADMLAFPAQVYKTDWQGRQLQYPTARTNQGLHSNDASQWTQSSVAVTANAAIAPDGTMSYAKIVPTTATTSHYVLQPTSGVVAGPVSVMFIAKPAGLTDIYAEIMGGTGGVVHFDLAAGTASGGNAAVTATSIVRLSDGSFLCAITYNAVAPYLGFPALFLGAYPTYTGDGVSGVYIWGGMFVLMSVLGSLITTTTAPVTVTDYAENIGGGILAATQDLSAKAMLGNTGASLTLDGSQI